jgi:hypothetical protein
MKTTLLPAAALLGAGLLPAAAVTFQFDLGPGGAVIPDHSLVGLADRRVIDVGGFAIQRLAVTLEIAGGYNGDYYVHLVHGSGFTVLLNRPGVTAADPFGYGTSGLDITLAADAADGDVHFYEQTLLAAGLTPASPLVGTWAPDGRPYGGETGAARPHGLESFTGLPADGEWILVVADLAPGDEGRLLGWGLEIQLVPEPAGVLAALGLALAGGWWCARRRHG